MKSKEELIRKGNPGTVAGEISFKYIKKEYEKCNKEIENINEKISEYNIKIGPGRNNYYKDTEEATITFASLINKYDLHKISNGEVEFTIGDCLELNNAIDYLLWKGKTQVFLKNGFDLRKIRNEIRETNEEYKEYIELGVARDGWYRRKGNIEEKLELRNINDRIHYHAQCVDETHYYIDLGDELRCAYCGFTTKDYDLNEEELEFLKSVVKDQKLILEEATKEDLPFIQVVVDEQEKELKEYEEKLFNDEEQEDKWEHFMGYTEGLVAGLRGKLRRAHKKDKKDYYDEFYEANIHDPRYYTYKEAKELVDKVNKEIKETTDEEKLKELKIKRYELLILAGIPLKEMYSRIKDESDKDYFVIAYSNLQDDDYKEQSGYFKPCDEFVTDAKRYSCLTADSEINKRLLKLRKTNNS
jgi:hypothetical protein